jgi:hypothetical protein
LVDCDRVTGSAFRIGPHLLLSVAHVVNNSGCKIDGEPVHVLYTHGDFAILSDDREAKSFIQVDCAGFRLGKRYLVVGHARGRDELTVVPVVGTGFHDRGTALLGGIFTAQPGQSGGVVLDEETMMAVGTVNTADWESGISGSVELKGTSICRRS